jgi:hypothetical protein
MLTKKQVQAGIEKGRAIKEEYSCRSKICFEIRKEQFEENLNKLFLDKMLDTYSTTTVSAVEVFETAPSDNTKPFKYYVEVWDFMGNPLNSSYMGYFDNIEDILNVDNGQ